MYEKFKTGQLPQLMLKVDAFTTKTLEPEGQTRVEFDDRNRAELATETAEKLDTLEATSCKLEKASVSDDGASIGRMSNITESSEPRNESETCIRRLTTRELTMSLSTRITALPPVELRL